VNRERVEEAELRSGDEIQIGKFKLVFLTGG
jgi:pSer/pThr/pTyr-binding forkhead associated (FHA) protein